MSTDFQENNYTIEELICPSVSPMSFQKEKTALTYTFTQISMKYMYFLEEILITLRVTSESIWFAEML